MKEQILANIKTNLKFYSRNALLLLILIVVLISASITVFFSISYATAKVKFEVIQSIANTLSTYSSLIIALLGILAVSSHIKNRCLKMVFTKPCSPDIWLLSLYYSIILVAVVLSFIIFLVTWALFLIWKIPFQWGLICVLLYNLFNALIFSFLLLFLGIIVHPILAIFCVLTFQESSFYWITTTIRAAAKGALPGIKVFYLTLADKLAYFIYLVLPLSPYQKEMERVTRSWIAQGKDWFHLGIAALYTLTISALLYFFSCYLLKRKRLI